MSRPSSDPPAKCVIDASAKLRNGLFLKRVEMFDDRIAFEVYASRPFDGAELADLSLIDDAGTHYTMIDDNRCLLDGHGRVEFRPAPPDGALFKLSQPGWASFQFRLTNDS
jgi:hypothetical protein